VGELNDILGHLRASLGPLSAGPIELDGGITNRNFRVTLGGENYVVRRPGRDTELLGIDRGGERIATEVAADLGIAPEVVASFEDCLVTRFVRCAPLEERAIADNVEEIARALHGFHDSGALLPTHFRVSALLGAYAAVVARRGGALPEEYSRTSSLATRIEAALGAFEPRPCHNDLLPGNVIRVADGGRMLLVDWEYAAMGDPRFDLGNLSVNSRFDEGDDERLLAAYYGAGVSDYQRAALRLARMLSDAREAAWGVVQMSVSELDFDFAGYAREHFARLAAAAEQQSLEELLDAVSRGDVDEAGGDERGASGARA
jgi:thiamine kinase-like enzyme